MKRELFRSVDFDKRQPHWSANNYFYTTWVGGDTYVLYIRFSLHNGR